MTLRRSIALLAALLVAPSACSTLSVGQTSDSVEAEPARDLLSPDWARYAWRHARSVDTARVRALEDHIQAGLAHFWPDNPRTPQELAEELIGLQSNAEHYYLYGRVLQQSEAFSEAIAAYQIALQLEPADPGLIHARVASVHSQLEDADAAYASLQTAVDEGFSGYRWISRAPEFGFLQERDDHQDRVLALIPDTFVSNPSNLAGDFEMLFDRGGTTYTFCENGRFREEYYGEGTWAVVEGEVQLTYLRYCEHHYQEATDDYDIVCHPVPDEERDENGEIAPSTLMRADDLKHTLAQTDMTGFLFRERSGPEPDFCSEPWDDAPADDEAQPETAQRH